MTDTAIARTAAPRLVAFIRRAFHIALLPLLAACGGGDGGTAPQTVESVSVSLSASSLAVGATTVATATARDAQGAALTGRTVAWSSSNSAVASVSGGGQVSAVSEGTAQIIATIEGRTGQASLTVTPAPVATVVVTLASNAIGTGESTQASASVRDAQGAVLTGRSVAWSTSNPSIASVSSSGLVTGVAAGTADIIATSEGRTGQVSVNVNASVSIGALTLRNASGEALDTTRVAGAIEVATAIDLPPGFRGVRVLSIDTVVYARDSVFGPAAVASSTFSSTSFALLSQDALSLPYSRTVETTVAVHVITADELRSTPLLGNGRHLVDLTITGQIGNGPNITRSDRVPIHTRNANMLRLFVQPQRTITLNNGRVIDAGDIRGRLSFTSFDGASLNEIEIIRAPAQPVYGADAIAGVASLISLTPPNLFREFSLPLGAYESGEEGTRFLLNRIQFGTAEVFPRIAPLTLDGNRPSIDGSGWATSAAVAAGIQLPAGIRYQRPDEFPLDILPDGYFEASSILRYIDNLAPRANPGFISPADRTYSLGARATYPNGKFGMSNNFIGDGATFDQFLHLDLLQPDLSGLPDAAQFEWYWSPALQSLFNAANNFSDFASLPESPSRTRYLGARAADGAGNYGEWIATASAGNPFTSGDQPAPENEYGIAPAIFAKLSSTGVLDRTGVRSGRVFNAAAVAASSFSMEGSGSVFHNNAVSGILFDYFDRNKCFRGFDDCTVPAVLGGTFNSVSGVLSFNDAISNIINARIASVGGNGDGVYTARYFAADESGTAAEWTSMSTWWNALIDRTAPTASGSVQSHSPTSASFKVSGSDALGLESLYLGVRFDLTHSLFPGGKVMGWLGRHDVPGDVSVGLNKTAEFEVTGTPITHGGFFNLATGIPGGPLYPVIGGAVQSRDWAFNYSPFVPVDVVSNAAPPAIPTTLNFDFETSSNSVCRDVKCPQGQSNEIDFTLNVASTTDDPPIQYAAFQLIPVSGGRVYHVGTDYEAVVTAITGGFLHQYTYRLLAAAACIPPGLYYAKVMAFASIVWFNNPFINLTVTGNSSVCTKPARSLGFVAPP